MTPLADGSILIVGDEQRRTDTAFRGILSAFAWAVGATIALGVAGGLWLSAQFLRRVDAMRLAAHGIMAGDWGRRIPLSSVNDDLSALARTFNRLFDRIEKLLLANKHVSADIAHDLRKPLAHILRRLEEARLSDVPSDAVRTAIDGSIAEIEGVLETFDALLRIGQIEAGARRAAFKPIDLAEITRDVVEAFQPAADEGGRTLVSRLDKPLPMQGIGIADANDREFARQCGQAYAPGRSNWRRRRPTGPRRLPHGCGQRTWGQSSGLACNLSTLLSRGRSAELAGKRARPQPCGGDRRTARFECSASDNHPGLKVKLTTADQDEYASRRLT